MVKSYILDACALIALFRDEVGAEVVADLINKANRNEVKLIMHKANLLEVYYDALRTLGKEDARLALTKIQKFPIEINAEISDEILMEAGRLKIAYKVSFADTFALAQTIVVGGTLVTSDHHELDIVDGKENITFEWIR